MRGTLYAPNVEVGEATGLLDLFLLFGWACTARYSTVCKAIDGCCLLPAALLCLQVVDCEQCSGDACDGVASDLSCNRKCWPIVTTRRMTPDAQWCGLRAVSMKFTYVCCVLALCVASGATDHDAWRQYDARPSRFDRSSCSGPSCGASQAPASSASPSLTSSPQVAAASTPAPSPAPSPTAPAAAPSLAPGIDTSGSTSPYGLCSQIDASQLSSYWCSKGALPDGPSRAGLKYGRQTVYGSSSGGLGWCGQPLVDAAVAAVAVSTKYLPLHGTSPNSPYCGQCMCIRIKSADPTSNPSPPAGASAYYGKVFKGRVMDMCPECEDDHIDLLAAKPYTDVVPTSMAYAVGVWIAEWDFVDCAIDCSSFF